MPPTFQQITEMLFDVSPYQEFNAGAYDFNLEGWFSENSLFKATIEALRPQLVIEVGSWMGKSASCIASVLRDENIIYASQSGLLCVDTWLGAREFWGTPGEMEDSWWKTLATEHPKEFKRERYDALNLKNGYPSVYYQFLANMAQQGFQGIVTPFPQTSTLAARWLYAHGVKAELIYIDASHEYEDVLSDIRLYSKIITPGGIILGDDYWLGDVRKAVKAFSTESPARLIDHGVAWALHF